MIPNRFRFRAFTKLDGMTDDITIGPKGFTATWSGQGSSRVNQYFDDPKPEAILMQSTGLLDKAGVEVFEGDILQDEYCQHCRAAVTFEDGRYSWDCGGEWGEIVPEHVTVIGNIYEHGELLKGKE